MVHSFVAACGVPSSIRPSVHRTFVRGGRPCRVPSVSLWAAFTLTVHINALFNERVHGEEAHAT